SSIFRVKTCCVSATKFEVADAVATVDEVVVVVCRIGFTIVVVDIGKCWASAGEPSPGPGGGKSVGGVGSAVTPDTCIGVVVDVGNPNCCCCCCGCERVDVDVSVSAGRG